MYKNNMKNGTLDQYEIAEKLLDILHLSENEEAESIFCGLIEEGKNIDMIPHSYDGGKSFVVSSSDKDGNENETISFATEKEAASFISAALLLMELCEE